MEISNEACDRPPKVQIFDLEHNGWHLIISYGFGYLYTKNYLYGEV